MKLWEKGIQTDQQIENFTVGKDRELDILLAPYDVLGSIAHMLMLNSIGLIPDSEMKALHLELLEIYQTALSGRFTIEAGVEDVHSQVELMLTRKLGDTGKKIHTARSRNDQVLLDIKLFVRDRIHQAVLKSIDLFDLLLSRSEQYRDILIPGYTHLQVAMPSSFGLWYAAYAECIAEDMELMHTAYRMADLNPLGSAAGYGTSFPVNRRMTTDLLGFEGLHYNVVNAQMSRGRTERLAAFALSALAGTLSRLATDVCLFASQNFGLITLPDDITTGSSIMPHKKNPDVFELIRARCNKIQALPSEIEHIVMNLPSGYFRDLQILKESFLPVFAETNNCLEMATFAISGIKPVENTVTDSRYAYLFSVEEVNKQVMNGIPFRDAYKMVARQIAEGTYNGVTSITHSHEGSIGNLCNDKIAVKMKNILERFQFERKDKAIEKLLIAKA